MQYVSPEQFDDARSVDTRSDVYSLGATLYLMLTSEYPFGKGTTLNMVERKLKNQFDPPIRKAPQLRPSVDAAICKALQADRTMRPASVAELVALLTAEKKVAPTPARKAKALSKAERERRARERFPVDLEALCRAVVNAAGKRWPGWILDVSTTGLCLHVQRRFEIGSLLEVSFSLHSDDSTINQIAKVRWAKTTSHNTWLLGCELVSAMSLEELDTICAGGLDRTKMV
jgi:serine/threonine protein kinase